MVQFQVLKLQLEDTNDVVVAAPLLPVVAVVTAAATINAAVKTILNLQKDPNYDDDDDAEEDLNELLLLVHPKNVMLHPQKNVMMHPHSL